jgi:hypothetical protein
MTKLDLILKREHFDDILSGAKTKEYREIRPKSAKKYCEFKEDGELVGPKQYTHLRLFAGYETNRPMMLVEVKDAVVELMEDEETGELLTFEENGNEYIEAQVVYDLGAIIEKQNC